MLKERKQRKRKVEKTKIMEAEKYLNTKEQMKVKLLRHEIDMLSKFISRYVNKRDELTKKVERATPITMQYWRELSQQTESLQRVGQKIGAAIMAFYEADPDAAFHADDLRDSVRDQCGKVAPASSDRVLRDLRKKGKINYEVTNRRKSLYQFLPVTKHATYQPELFTLNH